MKTEPLVEISRDLSRAVGQLRFGAPVAAVYNPLDYARAPHEDYLKRWGRGKKRVILLGINPGPFGMAQTGVPFGEVSLVRDFLGVSGVVGKPPQEHPKRPIEGFACKKSEVSGRRLWGWVKQRFGAPGPFFSEFFVVNWCPLIFMESSGKNLTPDKLPASEREALFEICDHALERVIRVLEPEWVIGVGGFAEARARKVLEHAFRGDSKVRVGTILHPSPASPAANRGWEQAAEKQLSALGILSRT